MAVFLGFRINRTLPLVWLSAEYYLIRHNVRDRDRTTCPIANNKILSKLLLCDCRPHSKLGLIIFIVFMPSCKLLTTTEYKILEFVNSNQSY